MGCLAVRCVSRDGSCRYDYVELRDGGSYGAALMGRFCGSTQPPGVYTSSGQALLVRFRTDSSVTRSGFKATVGFGMCRPSPVGGSVAEWLACWTRAQKGGPGSTSDRSRNAVE